MHNLERVGNKMTGDRISVSIQTLVIGSDALKEHSNIRSSKLLPNSINEHRTYANQTDLTAMKKQPARTSQQIKSLLQEPIGKQRDQPPRKSIA